MKKFAPREFAFLCAPIVVLGGGLLAGRFLHPPKPAPKLTLFSGWDSSLATSQRVPDPRALGWLGRVDDEEQRPRRAGYRACLFASGHGRSHVLVYSSPTPPVLPPSNTVNTGNWYENSLYISGEQFNPSILPVWVQKIEWDVEVVAVPFPSTSPTVVYEYPLSLTTLRQWAQAPRALYARKQFSTTLTTKEADPIQSCEIAEPTPNRANPYTTVRTEFRGRRSRMFRRLEAFDGHTRRLLWQDTATSIYSHNAYMVQEGSGGSISRIASGITYASGEDTLSFSLNFIPTSWGKVTLKLEAVFDPKGDTTNTMLDNLPCDSATLRALKSQGWIYSSREIALRDEEAKKAERQRIKKQFFQDHPIGDVEN